MNTDGAVGGIARAGKSQGPKVSPITTMSRRAMPLRASADSSRSSRSAASWARWSGPAVSGKG
nr:hypothetical protein [Microbacterium schleiferi]